MAIVSPAFGESIVVAQVVSSIRESSILVSLMLEK
jgi:hypothetical protein